MNRVIKFRGLTDTQAPTWVYGSLVNNLWNYSEHAKYPKGSAVCEILVSGESDCWEDIDAYEQAVIVIPESVGQFTGLKDRNGKEIYEGDLIAYDENSTRWLIEWQEAGFYAVRQDRNEVHVFSKGWFADAAIVIGNLYETPYLLPNNLK